MGKGILCTLACSLQERSERVIVCNNRNLTSQNIREAHKNSSWRSSWRETKWKLCWLIFFLINHQDDDEPDEDQFDIDGAYIPRIFFIGNSFKSL